MPASLKSVSSRCLHNSGCWQFCVDLRATMVLEYSLTLTDCCVLWRCDVKQFACTGMDTMRSLPLQWTACTVSCSTTNWPRPANLRLLQSGSPETRSPVWVLLRATIPTDKVMAAIVTTTTTPRRVTTTLCSLLWIDSVACFPDAMPIPMPIAQH